jgi:hypothetical protein
MPIFGGSRQDPQRARSLPSGVVRVLALAAILVVPIAIGTGWLDKLAGPVEKAASRVAGGNSSTLEQAAAHIKALPRTADGIALAAQATQEGHWRFVNRAGETVTAGTPAEMKRVVTVLHPDAKPGTRLAVYMTDDAILRYRATLKALPASAELFVVSGAESYRLLRRTDGPVERFFAEVRPNLVVELSDRRLFDEAMWQLARPLDKVSVRVLALEPGGPSTLPAWPRVDKATKRALIDVIDPASLPAAMGSVRGQTLVITGRIDRDLIYVQPSSGAERSLLLKDLFKASEEADVNLIVLHAASTPRQPGGRNWLWLTVEVTGLEQALQRARMADFLNALGGSGRRLAAVALPVGKRTVLDLTPAADLPGGSGPRPVSDLFAGMVSEIAGKVTPTAVQANLRSAERQQEIDRRLLPGIPSTWQVVYVVLAFIGLFGVPLSRAWWQRVWPPEDANEYAGRIGYWAARIVRGAAYALVFLPLTAPAAAPYNLLGQIAEGLAAPLRLCRRLTGRKAKVAPEPTAAGRPEPERGHGAPPPPPPQGGRARGWTLPEAARRLGNTRPSR